MGSVAGVEPPPEPCWPDDVVSDTATRTEDTRRIAYFPSALVTWWLMPTLSSLVSLSATPLTMKVFSKFHPDGVKVSVAGSTATAPTSALTAVMTTSAVGRLVSDTV